MIALTMVLSLILGVSAVGQSIPLAEVQLRSDPTPARVRPHESLVIQLLAYGEVAGEGEETRRVRLALGGGRFSLPDSGSGWISKPFRYQGQETEAFHQVPGDGWGGRLLGQALGSFLRLDSVLYTAPAAPGRYRVMADLQGKQASLTVTVDAGAPSRHPPVPDLPVRAPDESPHRYLAEHHAPLIAQETWFQPQSDYITRFDFDGDWVGDNNWDATRPGGAPAYVYYAVMETPTHWFLIYDLYHSRDYSDTCVAGTCHENDSEGLILTVVKDGSRFGRILCMETLAHNNVYSYRADHQVGNGIHDLDGEVEFYQSHPVVFVESGGHGVYGSDDSHSRYQVKRDRFEEGTGVTFLYRGRAERPVHPDQRLVGYELLPAYQHLWLRGHRDRQQHPRLFEEYFAYRPFGDRPGTPYPEIAGAFLGKRKAANKARPFWGWIDNRTEDRGILSRGQWGLDPAYAVQNNLELPHPFSLEYLSNPYLALKPPAVGQERLRSLSHPARPAFPIRAARSYDPLALRGRLDLRLRVDGNIDVFVQGETASYEVLDGQAPSDRGSEYSQGLPQGGWRAFEVEKQAGRGEIRLLEEPGPGNDFTLRFRLSDPRSGADDYHVRVIWELHPPVEPGPASGQGPTGTPDPGVHGPELFSRRNDPASYDQDREGEFELRGRIDDRVVITIQGDRVFARTMRGRPFELKEFIFSQPLPEGELERLEANLRDGRGEIRLLERPWEGNRFMAVVEIADPRGGADDYRLRLRWRR